MHSHEANSLWSRAPRWRQLVVWAIVVTVLVWIGKPWRSVDVPTGTSTATYAPATSSVGSSSTYQPPSQPAWPAAAPASPSTAAPTRWEPAHEADAFEMSPPDTPPSSAGFVPVYDAPVRSSVTWASDSGGSVSGGGLIASYCCAGPSSSTYASRAVQGGRHYWELTLSVNATKGTAGTWTNAGVTSVPLQEIQESGMTPVLRMMGRDIKEDGRSAAAIRWGEQGNYRTGDVFMFALDASRGFVNIGVNGQWKTGDPSQGGGITVGRNGSNYLPFVAAASPGASAEGDRWIANFGATRFRYPIPTGYGAFGTSTVVGQAKAADPASQVSTAAADFLATTHFNEVTVGGRKVPLPEGPWIPLAYAGRAAGDPRGDVAVLGSFAGTRITGVIAIQAAAVDDSQSASFPYFPACRRQNYIFLEQWKKSVTDREACWWINHAPNLWTAQPIMKQAKMRVDQYNGWKADVWINVGFRKVDANGHVTALHYFDPLIDRVGSRAAGWTRSEWHRDHIQQYPKRLEYIENRTDWGREWAPVWFVYR